MNVITIMNYQDIDSNNIKMCKLFIKQLLRHNPDCNLFILYESDISKEITDYGSKFSNVRFMQRPGSPDSWSGHHNIRFKLYNLTSIKEQFIFLDCDIFCLGDLSYLWERRNDQPFIGINHQQIPGHTTQIGFQFLNSGVQVVGDPDWYQYENFRDTFKKCHGNMQCPGWDQAHIYRYCVMNDYDYTHPDISYGWNSCAKYGNIIKCGDDWQCIYNGPADKRGLKTYQVYLNHYWWNFKPWELNCPIFNESVEI